MVVGDFNSVTQPEEKHPLSGEDNDRRDAVAQAWFQHFNEGHRLSSSTSRCTPTSTRNAHQDWTESTRLSTTSTCAKQATSARLSDHLPVEWALSSHTKNSSKHIPPWVANTAHFANETKKQWDVNGVFLLPATRRATRPLATLHVRRRSQHAAGSQ